MVRFKHVENPPSKEEWRRLFELALQVKELAPWTWMYESDIFGIESPETGEMGFVSVMGNLGEYLCVAVYQGVEAVYQFWEMQDTGPEGSHYQVLMIPQLHASLENRSELDKTDMELCRELGYKFKGRQEWPQFRAYRPSFLPWYLEADDARLLTHALEQTLDVAPRFRDDRSLFVPDEEEDAYLVRVPRQGGEGLVWEDEIRAIPPPEEEDIEFDVPEETVNRLKAMKHGRGQLLMDLFLLPSPVKDRGTRPYFPHLLLMVDESGFVLSTDLEAPLPTLDAMLTMIPTKVAAWLVKQAELPASIAVKSEELYELLEPLADDLGIKVRQVARMPALDEAKESLLGRFGRGFR